MAFYNFSFKMLKDHQQGFHQATVCLCMTPAPIQIGHLLRRVKCES